MQLLNAVSRVAADSLKRLNKVKENWSHQLNPKGKEILIVIIFILLSLSSWKILPFYQQFSNVFENIFVE